MRESDNIWKLGYDRNRKYSIVLCMFRYVENPGREIFHLTSKIPLDVKNSMAPRYFTYCMDEKSDHFSRALHLLHHYERNLALILAFKNLVIEFLNAKI